MRFSIAQKVKLLGLSMFLILSVIFGFYFAQKQKKLIDSELEERTETCLNRLSSSLEMPVLSNDIETIIAIVNDALAWDNIIYCRITDKKGETIYAKGEIAEDAMEFNATITGRDIWLNDDDKAAPYNKHNEKSGGISLAVSLSKYNKKLADIKKRTIVFSCIVFSIILLAYFAFLKLFLDRPLAALIDNVNKISSKASGRNSVLKSCNEFENLMICFNKTAKDLEMAALYKNYIDIIFKSIIESVIILDSKRNIKLLNQATLNLLKYDKSELIEKNMKMILEHDETASQKILLDDFKPGDFIQNIETFYVSKEGGKMPVNFSASSIANDAGQIQCIVCVAQDIKRRKEIEKSLKKSEYDLQRNINLTKSILIAAPYTHIVTNRSGTIISANLTAETMFEYTVDELIGQKVDILFPKYLRDEYHGLINKHISFKDSDKPDRRKIIRMPKECSALTKDGKVFPVALYIREAVSGNESFFVGIIEDITERKREEEKSKKSQEYLRSLIECSMDMIVSVDKDRNIVEFNSAAEKTFGYKKAETLGKNIKMLYPDTSTANYAPVILKETDHFSGELMNKRKNGEIFPVFVSASILKDAKGNVLGSMGVSRDISGLKRAEMVLREAKDKAECANRAKDEFLANMSHEIRTPLNGIIGILEMLMDSDLGKKNNGLIHTMNMEANSLISILNNILDFSKIEAGKLDLEKIPFDLEKALNNLARSFQFKAAQKSLAFRHFLSPGAPVKLIGDPVRLCQIFTNLVGNALKFTSKGEILLSGKLSEQSGDSVKFLFTVKDTGIGIPRDKQKSIFESFSQADGSTTRKYGGTGLGTTISKQLTELMDGEISFTSEEGIGSTFSFTATFAMQKESMMRLQKENFNLTGKKALIIDDYETNRYVLHEQLYAWGCIVIDAVDGKEAMEILNESTTYKKPFDIILTDFHLPEMDGIDLVKEIRKNEAFKNIPIVMLTSVGIITENRACEELNIQGYLTKPVNVDNLQSLIEPIFAADSNETGVKTSYISKHSTSDNRCNDKINILLAEDYPTNQQVALQHFQTIGLDVDLVENGLEAVEAYKNNNYDIIFMDIQMPIMDGFQATSEIRKIESGRAKPTANEQSQTIIIAMTAYATTGDLEKCFSIGMNDYVTKPLRREKLFSLINKWTENIHNLRHLNKENVESSNQINMDDYRNLSTMEQENFEAPINIDKAIEEFEGQKEFFMEVAGVFIENVNNQIGIIEQAILGENREAIKAEAHSIAGGALNITADMLANSAKKLEDMAKTGNLKDGPHLLDQFKSELRQLEDYIKKA